MSGDYFFKELYHSCAVNINTVIVKKELFETVGYFDEDQTLRGTEDLDFWLRIAKSVSTVYGSPNRNVYYRIHEGGIHLQRGKMLVGRLKILAKHDQDKLVGRMRRKREYRYLYRELINELFAENRREEIKPTFKSLFKKDTAGLGTLSQALFIRILPIPAFIKFSNGIIYRIAYRLERLSYRLFLK
jgi:GT2 family glycosyltransferase